MKTIERTAPAPLKKKRNSSYDNQPKSTAQIWTLKDLIELVSTNAVNPDPIAQRPQVPDINKPKLIMEALINDNTFGSGIILRDIREDIPMNRLARELYPDVSYLVIDGGHRIRSLLSFYNGELFVKDKDGNSIGIQDIDSVNLNLAEFEVALTIYTCTSAQARDIFRSVNKTTPTNSIENTMADEESVPCRKIREFIRYYPQYDNTPHELFSTKRNKNGKEKPEYWEGEVNPRRKWDEITAIVLIKAEQQNKSNPDAGETEITALANKSDITKNSQIVVKRFFNDCVKVSKQRQQKWKRETFALFQLAWFGHYAENKEFVIDNYKKYSQVFVKRNTELTADSPVTVTIDKKMKIKCDWFKKNIASFSTGRYQQKCYEMFMEGISEKDLGIIFRDKDRSKSRNVKEKHLALQGHKCFIDILIDGFENAPTLKLDDAIWGHDTGWALGGSTLDGKVIRKSHNDNMADDENFEQYVTRVKNRLSEEKAKEVA
jgi:hypothetical protein